MKGINKGSNRGLVQKRIPNSDIQYIEVAEGVFAKIDDCKFDELSKHCYSLSPPNKKSDYTRAVRGVHIYLGYKKYKSKKVFMSHDVIGVPPKGKIVDHINNDPLDNRLCNLQFATKKQNSAKQLKQKRKTSSKYKGVCWDKSRNLWTAHLKTGGRKVFSKRFDSEEDAARAYNEVAKKTFGEFALLNVV